MDKVDEHGLGSHDIGSNASVPNLVGTEKPTDDDEADKSFQIVK